MFIDCSQCGLVWSGLISSHFYLIILSSLVLSCLALSCLVLSCLILSYLILSYLILSYFILSYLNVSAMLSRSTGWVRVDAHDPNGDRRYTQARTGSLLPYANWLPGEPSTPGHCVYIGTGGGKWNDEGCDITIPIVCEYDIIWHIEAETKWLTIFLTTLSNAFSWMKIYEFW